MRDLKTFGVGDVLEHETRLRVMGEGASNMEVVADRVVRFLYDDLGDGGGRASALVRFYKTHPYATLPPDLQTFARNALGREPENGAMKCLALLSSAGELPEWNSRRDSVAHKAIPLESEAAVEQSPMIAALIRQLGLEVRSVLDPDPDLLVDVDKQRYNVFYVPEARDSPHVPAQTEFVIPYGIRSVLGFGSLLPEGDLFAVILFSRVSIPRSTADHFKLHALNVRRALLGFTNEDVFE